MPHKKNPVKSEGTVALAKMLRAHAHLMQELMEGYDERDASTWKVEFAIVPEAFLYFARALQNTKEVMADLEVHPDGMTENLEHFGSLVTSEAIMMELAEDLGRQTAHDVVYEHAMKAIEENHDLVESLRGDERVTDAISERRLEEISDPASYTGLSAELSRRAVENSRKE
jgi:adenylosuccinate lyase